ncbi:Hypothetical protein SRAE_X000029600 [Strongyloides ratti]|uniref:Uncharacterized protein n=1 Tax=Strongyloides ratti TaxID=34506 RepID=A0A090N0M9_STRRB|nr:Hypothetical protein SRAE_X000029600 [Strongyloides ratti]CEF70968.1 Hypothetical protein SRAE_X000029600 [Strongyloides ratti]
MQNEDFTVISDPIYQHFTGSHIFSGTTFYLNQLNNQNKTENEDRFYKIKPNIWIKTWVEYYLGWQIASSTFSILTLCLKFCAFKFKQSLLVIPNIVSLFIDIIINLLGFSVFLACILKIPLYMAFLLSSVCIHIISLGVTKKFYISLQSANNIKTHEIVY